MLQARHPLPRETEISWGGGVRSERASERGVRERESERGSERERERGSEEGVCVCERESLQSVPIEASSHVRETERQGDRERDRERQREH